MHRVNKNDDTYITQELIYYDGPVKPSAYYDIGDVQESVTASACVLIGADFDDRRFRYLVALREAFLGHSIASLLDVKDRGT